MKQVIETIPYKDRNVGFAVSIPDKPTKKAIIDLHGLGEKTNAQPSSSIEHVKSQVRDKLITRTGLPYLISKGFEIDFLVISPQMWGDGWWDANFVKAVYEYCKEKYGFEYCFGHGISAGGRGIGVFTERNPTYLLATATNSGVRSHEMHKRANVPHWDLCNSGDKTTAPKLNAPPLINGLVEAGGIGYYTLFEGFGHHGGFWNNTLNGTIRGNQLTFEELDIKYKKEYVPSNFPIGDWFDTFITEMAEPVPEPIPDPEPKPMPIEEGIIKPISVYSNYVTNAESIFDVEAGYEKIIDYNSLFKNDYSNVKREIIADFGSEVNLTQVAWLDMHGTGEWKLFASSDKNDWELLLTDNLSTFKKWHSKGVNVSARYIKIETYGHQLPVRIAFVGYGGEYVPEKKYTVTIHDLSEAEKNDLLIRYGNKARLNEN